MYRPTVHYAYHPCNDAVLSVHEFAGRNWHVQERKRILNAEIIEGIDELGVLLAGHKKNAYWYGSQLSIEEARKLVPHNTATSLQVCVAVLSGMVWAMENPQAGMIEPDEMDFRRNLEVCMPYLGPVVGVYGRLDAADAARRAVRGRPGSQRSVAVQERAGVSVRVSFNLDDADLEHLAAIAQQTQLRARSEPADAIIAGAREVLETANRAQLAGFVKERYSRLETMLQMVDGCAVGAERRRSAAHAQRARVLRLVERCRAGERPARSRDHDRAGQPRSAPRPGGVSRLLPLPRVVRQEARGARRGPRALAAKSAARACRSACTSGGVATWTARAAG